MPCSPRLVSALLLAVDPGTTESAFVSLDGETITAKGILLNTHLLSRLRQGGHAVDIFAIERVKSYGMPVGDEVFRTLIWTGRFIEAWEQARGGRVSWLYEPTRLDVRNHLCHSTKANDATVRQAIIDRYGGKEATRKDGPLYQVHKDMWQALGVGLYVYDTRLR